MKKSIFASLIVFLLLCISPIYAGGGPPSPTEATRPVNGIPDDTNEGSDWDEPQTSIIFPQDDSTLTLEAEQDEISLEPEGISIIKLITTPILHIFLKYGIN
ncbi:MAG: hypothetical protein R3F48_17455 [Candidatus Zixiibacteriota bacterium]